MWWVGPVLALQFLTILPIRGPTQVGPADFGRSIAFFPLVGLVIGGLLAVADHLAGRVLPPPIPSALTIALALILTGALHFDGWLDLCDALISHRTPEERLAILRDSRTGGYAVAGGIALMLVRFSALVALTGPVRPETLFLTTAWGRLGIAYAVFAHPYGRTEPRPGRFLKDTMTGGRLLVAFLTALFPTLILWGMNSFIVVAAAWIAAEGLARIARTRLPGLTGDVYGAINEVVEVTILLTAAALFIR
ncbi:MAG TPA: adenosylcobinamide-GDP ribazoletransferase [Dehalococcoidia bacterium]|nr:adenosylcobinamide-GDP ribazoletransferase [Dehalococcoidia bacterium]